MALKELAVLGMTLQTNPSTVVATMVMVSSPSTVTKAEAKGVYVDGDQVSVSAITVPSAGATIPDPGPYVVPFNAQAVKNKSEGDLVLRLDDETDTINATPMIPGDPNTPYPVSFTIKIVNANQTKVKGE